MLKGFDLCCPQRIEIGLMSKGVQSLFLLNITFGSVGLRNNGLTSGSVDMVGLKT